MCSILSQCRIPGYPGPVPDPRLPGPGAGCRLPGRPFFGLFPPKKFLKMHRDTPGIKKKSEKKLQKIIKIIIFCSGRPALKKIEAERTRFSTLKSPPIILE